MRAVRRERREELHMNKRTIGYWVSTGLVALAFGFGGVMDFLAPPEVVEGLAHLGYPAYFAKILGVWKVLGTAAILAPGLPRLKEWAYAGMIFDLTAASVSHAASGDDLGKILVPLVIAAIVMTSWALRPASRTLAASPSANADRAGPHRVASPA
jgi:uncharacterized membrane protein YphA (DoxX/SURF4 family)